MTPDETNADLISWTGGAFEADYSVNPHWDAAFSEFPSHPVTSGVTPSRPTTNGTSTCASPRA